MKENSSILFSQNTVETICAVVLLNSVGDALLQLRDEKPDLSASGLWVFPGGHKEPEEDIQTCAEREFFEETNYHCGNLRWLMQIVDSFLCQNQMILHIFWDHYDGQSAIICQEGQALEFISRERALDIAMPAYLVAIWDLVRLTSKNSK
ncbi:MAG: NUDIX hydrolase [Ignavibacteriales bacterium]|nr:NUDIX hydrolase [Ignavibacteriales bacterium]